jgi:hypothetical protein
MKKHFLLAIAVCYGQICFSQANDFHFRRKISKADSAGWYSLALPNYIFKNLNKDFSDLRVYQLNDKDTIEAPYILRIHQQEVTEEVFHPAAFNQVKKDGKQFFTFELPKGAQVNFIDMSFSETNFDGFATIEGSDDQKEWFEIEKQQRIISIANQNIDFYSGDIHFSTQRFHYLRVRIDVNKTLTLREATLKKESIIPAQESKTDLSWRADIDKKSKQTIIKIDLKNYQPVTRLVVDASEKVDYYRPFRLEQLSDSSNTPKGWQYFYSTVAEGYITSLDSNRFTFGYTLGKKMRVVIEDGDNTPLNIKAVSMFSPKAELIIRMNTGDHYLYYGSKRANSPNYDVVNFKNKIPSATPLVSLEDQEKLIEEEAPASALIQNKIWLWVLMAAVIVVLGFFTMRMMKEK